MTFETRNETGTVKINSLLFASEIRNAAALTAGRAFCASENGKMLGGMTGKASRGEIEDNIKIDVTDDCIALTFYIIVSFGVSIREVTGILLDYLEKEINTAFPDKTCRITLKITGIKSKLLAPRNIEITSVSAPGMESVRKKVDAEETADSIK